MKQEAFDTLYRAYLQNGRDASTETYVTIEEHGEEVFRSKILVTVIDMDLPGDSPFYHSSLHPRIKVAFLYGGETLSRPEPRDDSQAQFIAEGKL